MPPRSTRSSTRRGAAGASAATAAKGGKQQQSISFGQQSRITKPGTRSTSGSEKNKLEDKKSSVLERVDIPESTPEVETHDISEQKEAANDTIPTTNKDEETGRLDESVCSVKKPETPSSSLAIRPQAGEGSSEKLSAEEEGARNVSEAQIERYWAAKEAERTTRRVHQEGLSLYEKVLREFDMSSQFGNCIGIPRTRRWKLANELGLAPPIEVLAVLVKEGNKGKIGTGQRAYVDELMSSKLVV